MNFEELFKTLTTELGWNEKIATEYIEWLKDYVKYRGLA